MYRVPPRLIAFAALVVAAVAVVKIVGTTTRHTAKAVFTDASQLVEGAPVEIGGRPVGKITKLTLTPDFRAEAVMSLDDPIRVGTTAEIRAVGLSGVTNRFIELHPGTGRELPDGATIFNTQPIVELDTLLDSFDPPARRNLRRLVHESAAVLRGTAPDANRALRYLNPAVSQFGALGEEATRDLAAVRRLVTTGAAFAHIVAERSPQIEQGIDDTARALTAIAQRRDDLADDLARLPGILRQGTGTLHRSTAALRELRPTLVAAQPVAAPLADVLRKLPGVASRARPALEDLNALLPVLGRGLEGIPALARAARPALRSTAKAVRNGLPVFTGLRQYGPDALFGAIFGVGGTTTAGYDANGHFARFSALVGAEGSDGLASAFPQLADAIGPGTLHADDRCPGAAAPPARDHSNPWQPDPKLCDLGQSVK